MILNCIETGRCITIPIIVALALLLGAGQVSAGSPQPEENSKKPILSNIAVNGYIKNESAFQLRPPEKFSKIENLLELELAGDLMDWGEFRLLTWVLYDAVYDIYSEDFPQETSAEYGSNFTAGEPLDQIFREIYVDMFFKSMDVRLGKQQVVWGEAIGLRITDVVNPQDFREFILDDFTDSRIPLWMAKLTYYVGDYTFTGLWIPFFEPDRPALNGSTWEWTFNRIPPLKG